MSEYLFLQRKRNKLIFMLQNGKLTKVLMDDNGLVI